MVKSPCKGQPSVLSLPRVLLLMLSAHGAIGACPTLQKQDRAFGVFIEQNEAIPRSTLQRLRCRPSVS